MAMLVIKHALNTDWSGTAQLFSLDKLSSMSNVMYASIINRFVDGHMRCLLCLERRWERGGGEDDFRAQTACHPPFSSIGAMSYKIKLSLLSPKCMMTEALGRCV